MTNKFFLSLFITVSICAQEERTHIARDVFWIADVNHAIEYNDAQELREALHHGADRVDFHYLRAFFKQAKTVQIATVLLDRGLDVNDFDLSGDTLLHNAKTAQVAELLLDRGAKVDARERSLGRTPLHSISDPSVVGVLLERKADPNRRDDQGRTPLLFAWDREEVDKIKLLLAYGGDPDMKVNYWSAITIAQLSDYQSRNSELNALIKDRRAIEWLRLALVRSKINKDFGPIDSKMSMVDLVRNRELYGSFRGPEKCAFVTPE